jgi:hypothetical protein
MSDIRNIQPHRDKIVVTIANTASGRLLARAMELMQIHGITMGEAMDRARSEQ